MESLAPEIDVELIGCHRSGHYGVGDEEHVLIRGALKYYAVELSHRAARAVASTDPARRGLPHSTVGVFELGDDTVRLLADPDELRVPLHEIGRACVGKECRSRWSPDH